MKTITFEMFYMMINGCIYAYIYLWFGGIVACDIFLIGVQPCVTVCDRGGGSNLDEKGVTYF